MRFISTLATTAILASLTSAEIVSDLSFWGSHTFDNSQKNVGVENGLVFGLDAPTDQFIKSPWTIYDKPDDASPPNGFTSDNVERIKRVWPLSKF